MIRYSLKCRHGHRFESWFQSGAAFDKLKDAGHLACAVCGDGEVEKAIMAPGVPAKRNASEAPIPHLSQPASPAEAALRELRRKIEANSDYVGPDFAREARRIHDGDADPRAIYGEASLSEAKSLAEDGVPVVPIPWMTRRNG
jgi:hypothetical protein